MFTGPTGQQRIQGTISLTGPIGQKGQTGPGITAAQYASIQASITGLQSNVATLQATVISLQSQIDVLSALTPLNKKL